MRLTKLFQSILGRNESVSSADGQVRFRRKDVASEPDRRQARFAEKIGDSGSEVDQATRFLYAPLALTVVEED